MASDDIEAVGEEEVRADATRDDVEPVEEEGTDATHIDHPYDPAKTKIDSDRVSLDSLIRRLRYGEIDLQPDFQRHGDLWSDEKKSRLIESVLIRIPLPAFYFDGTDDNKWVVVDGLQRLSALHAFVIEKDPKRQLKLTGLEYLTQLNTLLFHELPRPMQRRIEETQVTLHIIRPGTPPEVKYNIFRRINTGGMVLNPQEIRHALNPGPVQAFLKELAESPEFLRATAKGISQKRMSDREFVLRFCAFTMTPVTNYKEGNMDRFLTRAMGQLNSAKAEHRKDLRERFLRAMSAAHRIFGNDAFRKRLRLSDARSQINKALFEAWSVHLGGLEEAQIDLLVRRRNLLIELQMQSMQDPRFVTSISLGTGDVGKVRYRFDTVRHLIAQVLSSEDSDA